MSDLSRLLEEPEPMNECVRAAGVSLAVDLVHTMYVGGPGEKPRPAPNTERIARKALEAALVPELLAEAPRLLARIDALEREKGEALARAERAEKRLLDEQKAACDLELHLYQCHDHCDGTADGCSNVC